MERRFAVLVVAMVCAGAVIMPSLAATAPSCLAGLSLGKCCSGEINCANVTSPLPECNRTDVNQFSSLTDGGCLCVAGASSCAENCQSCKAYPTCLAGVTSGKCCSGEIDCSRVTNPPAQCDRNSLTDGGCLCVAGKDSCGQYCQSCKAYTTPPTPPTLPSCLAGVTPGQCCSGEIDCGSVTDPPAQCNRTNIDQFNSLTDGGCLCVAGASSCAENCQSCKAYKTPSCLAGVTPGQCCSGEIDCSSVTDPPAQCDRTNITQFNSLTDRGCLCVAGEDSCGQYCQSCKAYTTPPTPPTLPSCLAGVTPGQCCSGEIDCGSVTDPPAQCDRTNITQFNSITDRGCLCVAGKDSCGQYCQSCKAYRTDGGA